MKGTEECVQGCDRVKCVQLGCQRVRIGDRIAR